jgi:hypothetical protein
MDLLEEKNVFYCKACVRYFPIRDDLEETKMRHCLTLPHIKYVEEYRNRVKWLQKREQQEAKEREALEKKLEKKKQEEEAKEKDKEKVEVKNEVEEQEEQKDKNEVNCDTIY